MSYNGIDTIITLTKALEQCSGFSCIRLDIQYNSIDELFKARLWLGDPEAKELELQFIYDICEDGTVSKVDRTVIL